MDPCPFFYRQAGQTLLEDLENRIARQESCVLLGLRGMGKSYCIEELKKRLSADPSLLVVTVHFRQEPAITSHQELRRVISLAVKSALPQWTFPRLRSAGQLLVAVEHVLTTVRRRVVLLATYVDNLAPALAQKFLSETQRLAERRELIAVFTGEDDLSKLVLTQESSDFLLSVHRYVVQAFDQSAFYDHMRPRLVLAGLPVVDPEGCLKVLWEETRGNPVIARAALWALHETQIREGEHPSKSLTPELLGTYVTSVPSSDALGMEAFMRITRVIFRCPECWDTLSMMLAGIQVPVQPLSPPNGLELAGMAVRNLDGHFLQFASPTVERLARAHYDPCRMGDLYATRGKWKEAFSQYRQLPLERRLRPVGAEDLARLQVVMSAFGAGFHSVATMLPLNEEEQWSGRMERLKNYLQSGCQLLLGFRSVSFWTFRSKWRPDEEAFADKEDARKILHELPLTNIYASRPPSYVGTTGVAYLLSPNPGEGSSGEITAVVLCEEAPNGGVTKARTELLLSTLAQFSYAYGHLTAYRLNSDQGRRRANYLKIALQMIWDLGRRIPHRQVLDPQEALRRAGSQLHQLGYRRITFSLVDVEETRIQGFVDCPCKECPPTNLAINTSFLLDDFEKDVQPWVVRYKQECVIDDWTTWKPDLAKDRPPINLALCEEAQTSRSFAVIPLLIDSQAGLGQGRNAKVFGTMHVEGKDGRTLTRSEIGDLKDFGRLIALAAQQSEQFHALVAALASDPDGVVILMRDLEVRFANDRAAERLGLRQGWQEDSRTYLQPAKAIHGETAHLAKTVLQAGKERCRHFADLEEGAREFIRVSPLFGWQAKDRTTENGIVCARPVGCVAQIRSLDTHDSVFRAIEKVAASATDGESVKRAILEAVKNLFERKVRLYLVAPDNENLTSALAEGLSEVEARAFAGGEYHITRSECEAAGGDAWRCLIEREPCIHKFDETGQNGEISFTDQGLPVKCLTNPSFKFPGRQNGHIWIDLPLFANGGARGKIAMDCGSDGQCTLTVEEYELLRIFAALLGTLLDGLERLDRKEQWAQNAIYKAVSDFSHTVGSLFRPLVSLGSRYENAAPGNEKVKFWNSVHEPAIIATNEALARIRQIYLDEINWNPSRCEIKPLLQTIVTVMRADPLSEQGAKVRLDCEDKLEAWADSLLLTTALNELHSNSRSLKPNGLELHVEAKRQKRQDADWVIIRVKDNGPGIAPENYERVFDLLFSHRPGMERSCGLGLAHVRRIMKAHGGHARIVTPGTGKWNTVVELSFPITPPP